MHPSIGRKVKDIVTGFMGIVLGRCEYISGCNQLLVHPGLGPDGAMRESLWMDEQRLEFVYSSRVVLDNGASPGFDKEAPKR